MNFSNYLSKILFGFILFLSFSAFSQQQQTMKCTMDDRQILRSQSFTEDAVEAEAAREIFKNFKNTLNLAYSNINNNAPAEVEIQVAEINTFIQTFQSLGLNYSMFNDDIESILNYN